MLLLLFQWKDINFYIKALEMFDMNVDQNNEEILGFYFSHSLSGDQIFILC